MDTTADVAVPRARDTLDRGPHPDDNTFDTPDHRAGFVVDGLDDTAHADAPDPLNAQQLAAFLAAGRAALLELEGRATNRDRIAAHIAREARDVADLYTPGQVRAHLDFAQVVGRDDLDVRVWQAAQDLLALVDDLVTDRHVQLHAADTDDQLLAVLELVDRGELQWRAGTDTTGPVLHDLGDIEVGRPAGPAGDEVVAAVDDLRADALVQRHVMRTTDRGWAVVRAAHRTGALRYIPAQQATS